MKQLFYKGLRWVFSDRLYAANVLSTFLSQFFSALSLLVLTPLLYSRLGEEQFASYGLIISAVTFGAILDLGMNTGMLRRIIKEKEKTSSLFSSLMIAYGAFFIVLMLVLLIFHFFLPAVFKNITPLQVFYICLLIFQNMIAGLLDIMIQSSQKIFKGKLIRMFKIILEFILILWVLQIGSLDDVMFVMVLVNFLYLAVLFFYARSEVSFSFHPRLFSTDVISDHAAYSFWYFFASLATVLVFNSQVFILDRIASSTLVAGFLLYSRFFDLVRISISNFVAVLFPTIVVNENEDSSKLIGLYFSAMRRAALLLAITFFILFFWGDDFFQWWSKGHSGFDRRVFILFLVFIVLILLDNVSAIFLSALKLNRTPTVVGFVQGVLAIFFSTLTVKEYGLFGVVLSSIIALCFTSLFFNPYYLIKHLREQ